MEAPVASSSSDHGSSLFNHQSVHRATGSLIEGPPTGGAWDNIESAGGIPKPLSPSSNNVGNSGYESHTEVTPHNPEVNKVPSVIPGPLQRGEYLSGPSPARTNQKGPFKGRHGDDAGTQRGNSPWFRRG